MAMTLSGITRTIALYVLILTGLAATALCYSRGQIVWGVFLTIILLLTVAFEVYGRFISKERKTISSMWKAWAIKEPGWAYTALTLLCLAFNALILHLAVW